MGIARSLAQFRGKKRAIERAIRESFPFFLAASDLGIARASERFLKSLARFLVKSDFEILVASERVENRSLARAKNHLRDRSSDRAIFVITRSLLVGSDFEITRASERYSKSSARFHWEAILKSSVRASDIYCRTITFVSKRFRNHSSESE